MSRLTYARAPTETSPKPPTATPPAPKGSQQAVARPLLDVLPDTGRTAIFVTHGMGQQVPFETLNMVVDGLQKAPGRDWTVTKRRVRHVRVEEEDLRRVEVTLQRNGAGGERTVDIYESYWAPLTEGKVGILDVIGFLVGGGLNGVRNGLGPFKRWMFGEPRTFPPTRGVILALLMALGTIASLVAMNAVALALVAESASFNVSPALQPELTYGLLAFLLLAGLLGTWVALASVARRFRSEANLASSRPPLHAVRDAGMVAFAWSLGGAVGVLLGGAAVALAHGLGQADALTGRVAALGIVAGAFGVLLLLLVRPLPTLAALVAGGLGLAFRQTGIQPTLGMLLLGLASLVLVATAMIFLFGRLRRYTPFPHARANARRYRAFHLVTLGSTLVVGAGLALAPQLPLLDRVAAWPIADFPPGGAPARSAALLFLLACAAVATSLLGAVAALPWRAPAPGTPAAGGLLRGRRVALGLAGAVGSALLVGLVGVALLVALQALMPVGDGAALRILAAWGLVAAASFLVQRLLVQYLGDVAAYVSPHKLDRFAEVRTAIKERVKATADAVYALRSGDGQTLAYDRILIVAHSLGSVVAYDTLNALLLDDEHASLATNAAPEEGARLADLPRKVRERTKLLVTFGSPLERTAFVFATQRSAEADTRDALASLVQPLISVEGARNDLMWVNVHSPGDIIGSPLTYYDMPDRRNPNPVEQIEDEDAVTPLAAHIEYWGNVAVWRPVVEKVFA